MKTFISDISKKEFPESEKIFATTVRPSILATIQKKYPEFNEKSLISSDELNIFREEYISNYLQVELGELTDIEKTVINSIAQKTPLTGILDDEEKPNLTFGERTADKVAEFGGSWTFIISFFVLLIFWISLNAFWLKNAGFDPYPFILLNLILSCIAALQAPVIMMSQNRQESKDRERAKKDYKINLKSELEIRELHEKVDHLIINYQHELLEIQKEQINLLTDIQKNLKK